jgi:hypothetical protein
MASKSLRCCGLRNFFTHLNPPLSLIICEHAITADAIIVGWQGDRVWRILDHGRERERHPLIKKSPGLSRGF